MCSKINQIRYELEKLYESKGLSKEVLELSRQLDKEINEIQKKKLQKIFSKCKLNIIHKEILYDN